MAGSAPDRGKPKSPIAPKSLRPLVGQHQRHAIDDQRLDDPRHQALAETDDVEIGVEIPREADQGASVVVAVAVEQPIQRVLQRLLHRLRQQHDDRGREHRDDPVVRIAVVCEKIRRQPAHADVQQRARREKRRVRQPALDDDFDVPQAIPDDRRRERQRHEPQRNRGQLQRQRRIDAERPRQRVAECERRRRRGPCPRQSTAIAAAP